MEHDGEGFLADSDVATLASHDEQPSTSSSFGIILVANWPPPIEVLQDGYQELVDATRTCFAGADQDACYYYPVSCLHVTVATFHSFKSNEIADPTEQETFVESCVDGLNQALADFLAASSSASSSSCWELRPQSAELHNGAAVILWEEITGGLNRFRQELRHCAACTSVSPQFFVPDIVHSTYLRFARVPQMTVKQDALTRYNETVAPLLQQSPHWRAVKSIPTDSIRLVVERGHYMHPPTQVVKTIRLDQR
jgi:hypothetical protein